MGFQPHKFGRYIILDPLAVGGMAEIYRARLASDKDAPDRILIIKKVIANLSQNSEFVAMFEEEIKITVGLTHPNITQIYDYGRIEGQSYLAMEYVEGKDLRKFVKRLNEMKSMFSIDMSCYIISQVCNALSYAHAFKDRLTGKHLNIVHRDISPQNMMLSYDGAVKLLDFGIAKAQSAGEATQAGVIKGKPSYLSPEQINGDDLDGRSDVFALGIVLWELLTAKRLFAAENDMATLRKIQVAKIESPTTFNPAVPQALSAIVLRSLERDRNKRYQSAEEFQRELHKFLYSFNPSFNPADLSYYAQELFKQEIQADRERLFAALKKDVIDAGLTEDGTQTKKKQMSTKLADGFVSGSDFNREALEGVNEEHTYGDGIDIGKKKGAGTPPASPGGTRPGAAGGSAGSKGATWVKRGAAPRSDNASDQVIPPWAKKTESSGFTELTKKQLRVGSHSLALERELKKNNSNSQKPVALVLLFLICALGYFGYKSHLFENINLAGGNEEYQEPIQVVTPMPQQRRTPAQDKPIKTKQPEKRAAAQFGILYFESNLPDYTVKVNGLKARVERDQVKVPINSPLKVELSKFGYAPVSLQTIVESAADPKAFEVKFTPLPGGQLTMIITPPVDVILIRKTDENGRSVASEEVLKTRTPIDSMQLPAGKYRAILKNSILGIEKEMNFEIKTGQVKQFDETIQ